MKISERTIKRLGEIITGDKALSPYRSGPKLVSFFNDFGTNHAYGQGFRSRWTFAYDLEILSYGSGPGAQPGIPFVNPLDSASENFRVLKVVEG